MICLICPIRILCICLSRQVVGEVASWHYCLERGSRMRDEVAIELRQLREELRGLRDTVAQIAWGSQFVAPQFLFAEAEPISEEEEREKAQALFAEAGRDYSNVLRELRRYSELFFLAYCEQRRKTAGGIENVDDNENLKLAIQCEQNHSAFQYFLFRLYQRDFRNRHKQEINEFRSLFKDAELIVLHFSCRPNQSLARSSAASFVGEHSRIHNVIVVGHPSGKRGDYSVDSANSLLVVPANDAYEGLSEKAAAAYAFLAFSGNTACILKVDDDIRCLEPERLVQETLPLVRSRDYIGRVWYAKYGISRSWRLGKCQNPELNTKPYGLLADACFAEGPAYFLSSRAVHVLGKVSVYLEQLFEVEHYEDVAVGKVLNHYGIIPLNYDPIQNGLFASTDAWMMERAGLPPIRAGQ